MIGRHLERELKLGVPSGFSLARVPAKLRNYVAAPPKFLRLHTIYYDTDDLRLARWGCDLRFRRGEGWTLKIPVLDTAGAAAGISRVENRFDGDAERVPAGALDLAAAFLRGAPVRRVAELRTLRVKRDVACDGSQIAEVVEDDVRVLEGTNVARRFAQLEIELTNDDAPQALDSLASALQDEGAGAPDPTRKNARALSLDNECEIEVPSLDARATIRDLVRSALGSALVQYIRCDPLLRSTDDVEAVHKARVGIRMLRSHLHSFLPVLDERWARDLRTRLKWLQDALAPVRDADVFAEHMRELAASLSEADARSAEALLEELDSERPPLRAALRERIRDPEYLRLLDATIAAVRSPRLSTDGTQRARACASVILERAYRRTRKAVRAAGRPPTDRALHEIRIKAKHLRYASEAFTPIAGACASKYASRVESLQDVLGEAHDAVVAVDRLRDRQRYAQFAAGELAGIARAERDEGRRAWRKIWRSLTKKKHRFW